MREVTIVATQAGKPDLLLLDRFRESTETQLEDRFVLHRFYDPASSRDLPSSGDIRAIVTSGAKGAPVSLLDRLPKLEIIAIRGVGTDGVDLEYARQRNIRVTTTPNLLTDDVADLAMALLLAVSRGLCLGDRFVRDGQWGPGMTLPLGRKVTGLHIGILGLGRVGRAIADRAKAFRMKISYTDMKQFDSVDYEFVPDVLDLASQCDALILAASGGSQSHRIVNEAVLKALGDQGILINVARGSLVDEAALVSALTNGRLLGAGLDVFSDEPNVPMELWRLDNVVLQPHRASATVQTRLAMENLVCDNLQAHFTGAPLPSAVQ
jgi:lactate dehydrogenase-like 2-hydroxyacid dehydrogenase